MTCNNVFLPAYFEVFNAFYSEACGLLQGRPFMFFKKKKETKTYDSVNKKPMIRVSICTGEQVAGFKDIHTGKFEEVLLIRDEKDLEGFLKTYGLEHIDKEY